MKSVLIGCISYVLLFHLGNVGYAQPFTLPALAYSYDALEPSIDAQTMEIHHTRHHQAYVNNLNKAVTGTPMEKWSLDVLLLGASKIGDAIRNNGGGRSDSTLV